GSNWAHRASTRLYLSTQNPAASSPLPVHSECVAIRAVRRKTFTSLLNSFSRSITFPPLALPAEMDCPDKSVFRSAMSEPAPYMRGYFHIAKVLREVMRSHSRY